MARIRRVDCSSVGIRRVRRGGGFAYLSPDGERIADPEVLRRIKDLVIPPAWRDVWICPFENGHIQATGIDAAGRRQYLYHTAWRTRRDQEKFDHMIRFARSLPDIRSATLTHLADEGLTKDRVLACAVRLLDRGFFRIGTEGYAEQNQTYGLATIKKTHVTLYPDGVISFDYIAKSGKQRIQSVVDPQVHEVVKALKRRRSGGDELLAYRASGVWVDVKSNDINDYIREVSGGDFTAKDFRTWSATVLAAVALAVSAPGLSATARRRAISRAVDEVAHYLGNTAAVCRKSYIDPRVFDRYQAGTTIAGGLEGLGNVEEAGEPAFQGAVEQAVLDLIEERDSPVIEKIA